MASSQQLIALCFCLLLVSSSILVDAQGMGGLMGGGKNHKHGGDFGIETLLAAGIVAAILQGNGGGGFGGGRSASARHTHYEAPAHAPVPYAWRQPVTYVSEGNMPQPVYRMPPQSYGY